MSNFGWFILNHLFLVCDFHLLMKSPYEFQKKNSHFAIKPNQDVVSIVYNLLRLFQFLFIFVPIIDDAGFPTSRKFKLFQTLLIYYSNPEHIYIKAIS
jgi:hypothetical protein